MICPYCDYKYGYEFDDILNKTVNFTGKDGDFWKSPLPMQRDCDNYHSTHEIINVYACPACEKLFLINN